MDLGKWMEPHTARYAMVAGAIIILIVAGLSVWRYLQKTRHQRHTKKVLKSLGVKYLHDVVLPDGVEGLSFIDYLLLIPDGIVVLDVKYSEGHLFGGNSIDQWSQVIKNKTRKFDNPLYANQTRCQAVLWNLGNTNIDTKANNLSSNEEIPDPEINNDAQLHSNNLSVHGRIAFAGAGNFPKGIPDQVIMIDELKNNLEQELNLNGPVSELSLITWVQLQELCINTRAGLSK